MQRRLRTRAMVAVGAAGVMLLAACSSSPSSSGVGQARATGGTVTVALSPGEQFNYILPLLNTENAVGANIEYSEYLMWRPLYWFGGPNSVGLDEQVQPGRPGHRHLGQRQDDRDDPAQAVPLVRWPACHQPGRPVLVQPAESRKGQLVGLRARGIPDNVSAFTILSSPVLAHLLRRLLRGLAVQRAWPAHPHSPADVGQGVGDRAGGQLRPHPGRCARRLQLPGRPEQGPGHLRHEPAVAGRRRALPADQLRRIHRGRHLRPQHAATPARRRAPSTRCACSATPATPPSSTPCCRPAASTTGTCRSTTPRRRRGSPGTATRSRPGRRGASPTCR